MPEHGVSSGTLRPVMIPDIADVADIQSGLKNFYYGSVESSSEASEGNIPLRSILGRIIEVDNKKVNIDNGIANSPLTVKSLTTTVSFKLENSGGTATINSTGGNKTFTLPSSGGTFALANADTFSSLANIGTGSVGTITLGSASTTTFSIATADITGSRMVNIGTGTASATRTINIGSGGAGTTRIVNIGNSGTALNTAGTLTHTGNAGITGVLTMTGNIAMGGAKITGLAAASAEGQAVRYEQPLMKTGGTMTGAIAMGGAKITGLAAASANGDAVRYEQISMMGIYQSWNPTIVGASANPTNYSASGRYCRVGNMVTGWANYQFTTGYSGSGTYYFPLPVAPKVETGIYYRIGVGTAIAFSINPDGIRQGQLEINPSRAQAQLQIMHVTDGAYVTDNWHAYEVFNASVASNINSSDSPGVSLQFTYEAA